MVLSEIDWGCEVQTRFLDENLGCGKNIYRAINWFFENEKEGLIIEDDVVPKESFFEFCSQMLDKYRDDKKIWHIGGTNFIDDLELEEDYYFSKIAQAWGWATWRDRWEKYDFNLMFFKNYDFKKFSKNKAVQKYWRVIHDKILKNEIDTWDYQWVFKIVKNKGFTINPTKNLTTNIGTFGVHYSGDTGVLNKKAYNLNKKLTHPKKKKVDDKIMNNVYSELFLININEKKQITFLKLYKIFMRCLKIKLMEL